MAKRGKTMADLRAAHDRTVIVPARIRAALAALAASGSEWEYESDFMALATPQLSGRDIAAYRDEFTEFWAIMPAVNGKAQARRVWFASKKLADTWKGLAHG